MMSLWLCYWFFLIVVSTCLLYIDCGKQTPQKPPKPPAAGWCRTSHKPKKPAQSGYDGYCKACYQDKFPNKYKAKLMQRKKQCAWCMKQQVNTRNGFCKPCISARSCETCSAVNTDKDAVSCVECCNVRERLGATQTRLALWCVSCTSVSDRDARMCRGCLRHLTGTCHHCRTRQQLLSTTHHCADSDCGTSVRFCAQCAGAVVTSARVQCKTLLAREW